jgi:hypothetical protein
MHGQHHLGLSHAGQLPRASQTGRSSYFLFRASVELSGCDDLPMISWQRARPRRLALVTSGLHARHCHAGSNLRNMGVTCPPIPRRDSLLTLNSQSKAVMRYAYVLHRSAAAAQDFAPTKTPRCSYPSNQPTCPGQAATNGLAIHSLLI